MKEGGDSRQPLLPLQVYDHRYKAVVDGVETDSVMEIDPRHRVVTFRMGNGSKEILEVHDFKNASTLSQERSRRARRRRRRHSHRDLFTQLLKSSLCLFDSAKQC